MSAVLTYLLIGFVFGFVITKLAIWQKLVDREDGAGLWVVLTFFWAPVWFVGLIAVVIGAIIVGIGWLGERLL